MWSLLPLAILAIIGSGIGVVFVAVRNGKPVRRSGSAPAYEVVQQQNKNWDPPTGNASGRAG